MKCVVLLLGLTLSVVSLASTKEIEAYLRHSKVFEEQLDSEISKGQLPRMSQKDVRLSLEIMKQSQDQFLIGKYSVKEFGDVVQVCGKANKFGMSYLLHDLKSITKNGKSPEAIQQKLIQLMKDNSIEYQNELKIFYPFLLECSAIEASLLEPFWASLPENQKTQIRIGGLNQIRMGVLHMYEGVLSSLGDSSWETAFNDLLMASASKKAPDFAAILTLEKRNTLLGLLEKYKATAPKKYSNDFEKIFKSFSTKECNSICRL